MVKDEGFTRTHDRRWKREAGAIKSFSIMASDHASKQASKQSRAEQSRAAEVPHETLEREMCKKTE